MKAMTPKDLKHLEQTLAQLKGNVRIIYFTEEVNCRHCRQERDLLTELADLSHKLELDVYNFTADRDQAAEYHVDKVPGFLLMGEKDHGIRYYGMPSDFEFRTLLEDMVRISSGQSGLSSGVKDRLQSLTSAVHLEVLTTPGCALSAPAERFGHQLAIESDLVTADIVNLEDFPEMTERYKVMGAPTVVVNGSQSFYGVLGASEFVDQVLKAI